MYKEIFGQRLKKVRQDMDLKQIDVAVGIGVDRSQLSKWENGDQEPSLEMLGKLADFYCVSVDWLLGTSGGKNNSVSSTSKIAQ